MQHTEVRTGGLASAARSVLSCAGSMELAVNGIVVGDPEVRHGMDEGGVPLLRTASQSALLRAAREAKTAILRVSSAVIGLEGVTVSLVGTLGTRGEDCCAANPRTTVELVPTRVLIAFPDVEPDGIAGGNQCEYDVPLADFHAPEHELNPGYLQASLRHANGAHGEELRLSVARCFRVSTREILAASIVDVTRERLIIDWVDSAGADRGIVAFPETATSREHLTHLVRGAMARLGE